MMTLTIPFHAPFCWMRIKPFQQESEHSLGSIADRWTVQMFKLCACPVDPLSPHLAIYMLLLKRVLVLPSTYMCLASIILFSFGNRRGHDDLGDHYLDQGDLSNALKCYSRARDYCTSPKHIINMCLNVIKVSTAGYAHVHDHSWVYLGWCCDNL